MYSIIGKTVVGETCIGLTLKIEESLEQLAAF